MSHGTRLAVGIILLWAGGFFLFIAFLSGKVGSLTTSSGTGPADASELAVSLAGAIQATEGPGGTPSPKGNP